MSEEAGPVEVTRQDQTSINAFGRLNMDFHALESRISETKKRVEHLEEAQNELMLVDDEEAARYLVGECFLHVSTDTANDWTTNELEKLTSELESLESKKESVAEEMSELKQTLYGKFGKQINLDEDPTE